MIYFFVALVLLILFLNFELIAIILKKNSMKFKENKKKGTAEVVGYDSSEQSRWYSLIVKVLELNDGKTYIVNSAKINIHDYPKGSILDVIYSKIELFGKELYQVYLPERMPPSTQGISKVFKVISIIILLATIGFCVAGVYSIFV